MHNLSDTEAVATWEHDEAPDPNASSAGVPYRCTACDWTGRGETALRHFRSTGHAIRGRNWSAHWPDAQFTPFATYAFDQPMPDGTMLAQYQVHGGTHDRSTVSEFTLRMLGIRVQA